jgi:hypothetical protein
MLRTAPADVFKLPNINQKLIPLNQHMNDYYLTEDTGKTREYSDFWRNLSSKLRKLRLGDVVHKETVASMLKNRTEKIKKAGQEKEEELIKKQNWEIVKFYNNIDIIQKIEQKRRKIESKNLLRA